MGHTLQGIALAVGPVVSGIDAPSVAGAVMGLVANAVQHRVAHEHVLMGHVYSGPQHPLTVGELAGPHATEQVQVLINRPVPPGAVGARFGEAASGGRDGRRVLVVHIGQPGPDQVFRPVVERLEVIGGVKGAPIGLVTQPSQVVLNGGDEIGSLGLGVGVVQAEVASAVELAGQVEVQTDGLGVADVEIAVGFGGEPGLHPTGESSLGDIPVDQGANEVAALARLAINEVAALVRLGINEVAALARLGINEVAALARFGIPGAPRAAHGPHL